MAKRIAQMLYSMGMGGVENFLMNIYRNIDREKYQFDFILQTNERSYFDDEIEKLGGRIFRIPRFERHPIEHIKELKKILKENEYIAFHRHTANSVVFYDMIIAKCAGIKTRIAHSHSTTHEHKIINYLSRPFLKMFSTKNLACGIEAGKWLYGKGKFEVLNNGIDVQKFCFNDNMRKVYRQKLNINDKIVIGHVGRFENPKNHKFLIDMFVKLCEKSDKYELILCGEGSLREKTQIACKEKGIEEKVKFLGARQDVNCILQAMDIFVFPSLYEGLPITLIEAQMSGIPIIMSDKIPAETIYNSNVQVLGISDSDIDEWCEKIIKCKEESINRKNIAEKLIKEYDVKSIVNKLEKIYDGE